MNIPNTITMIRLVMTVFVFVCLEVHAGRADGGTLLPWLAFALFVVAAITDFLDGYLARKWNMVTAFGRIADPFADKILIAGTMISLLQLERATDVLTHWYVVIVVAREFLVTAIRGYVESMGKAFGADRLGKWKMVSQCWLVGALLAMVAGSDGFRWAAVLGFWVSLFLTVVSGFNYCVKARFLIRQGAV
ncbi:MAG: CDP-diacylglycerol--glycerol-3-phosphate 3-phosphatidyltransferase [Planctomycetes bacterium]|nr:CDP-diacylglycerol--glycerol-3-phosphate 3-phosphatidyltransferase [Planctomycetota bacterium]